MDGLKKEQQLKKERAMKPFGAADTDENDSVSRPHHSPLSAVCTTPSPAPVSPYSPSSPSVEARSPFSVARHSDPTRNLPRGLDIPCIDTTSETTSSSLSYLMNLVSPVNDDGSSSILADSPLSPGEVLGFSKEMSRAFADGTLLPYFVSLMSSPLLPAIQDDQKTTWNGHLPLDPYDVEEETVQWAMPRSRRRRLLQQQQSPPPSEERPLSPHTIFPTTLNDPNQVEILFHSSSDILVCFFLRVSCIVCFCGKNSFSAKIPQQHLSLECLCSHSFFSQSYI